MEETTNNLELVRNHYGASGRGDLEGMLAPLAASVTWVEAAGSLYAGTYVGPQAVVEGVFGPINEQWEGFTVDIERIVDGGDELVALGTYSGTHRGSGRRFAARMVHVWTLSGGEVVRFEQIVDNAPMNEASGR